MGMHRSPQPWYPYRSLLPGKEEKQQNRISDLWPPSSYVCHLRVKLNICCKTEWVNECGETAHCPEESGCQVGRDISYHLMTEVGHPPRPLILPSPRPPVPKTATTNKCQWNFYSPIPVILEYVWGLLKNPGTPQQTVFLLIGLLVWSRASDSLIPGPGNSFLTS